MAMKLDYGLKEYFERLLKNNKKDIGIYFFGSNVLVFDIYNPKDYFLLKPFKGKLNLLYSHIKEEEKIRYYYFIDNFLTVKELDLIELYSDDKISIRYTELEFKGNFYMDIIKNERSLFKSNPFYNERRKVIIWDFKG